MAAVDIRGDEWLSGLFARPVFQIQARNGAEPAAASAEIVRHAAEQHAAFYYSKIDVADVPMVSAFISSGMIVVDVNVTFAARAADARTHAHASNFEIREALPVDAEATLAIAEHEYQVSRFHRDPLVPTTVANRIKRNWVENYLTGKRGERLWIAVVDGEVGGFLAVMSGTAGAERVRTIDLVAVKASKRGRGVGSALVGFFLRQYTDDCDRLQVGTQIANGPSIRMYERAGMHFDRAQFVLHLHRP